jgi:hypothetical protein
MLAVAVITSEAKDKSQNRLDTGTISFSDIENKADYQVSSSSAGVSSSGMPSMPTSRNKNESEHSTTHSAVSEGTIIIRNKDAQKQDINELSRDTEQANNELKHIFNKQKEQDIIDQTQLVSEIGGETLTMLNHIDRIRAEYKAKEAVEKEKEKGKNKGLTEEEQQKIYEDAYKKAMNEGMSAMGSDTRQGIDMAVSIINGLISGDMAGAAAGALAPKIATIIKQQTEGSTLANTVSHAILGAVVAELQGNSALVGGLGAVASERGAEVIAGILYPDKTVAELSQEERQQISALSQLATGLATAAAGGDIQDINTGVAAGKNAVENNYFGQAIVNAAKSHCDGNKDCEDKIIKEGIDSYNETIIEYGTPQVIAIGAVIAAPIVEPAVVACSANPVLCANQVATWLIETVGFEGNPAMGLGMTAGVYVNSLSKAELNELAAIMTLEKNKLIKNSSPVIDELKVTLSEDSAHKLVYDIKCLTENTLVWIILE